MSNVAPSTSVPRLFLVVTFAVAIAVSALIAYFGITGQIGGPIP